MGTLRDAAKRVRLGVRLRLLFANVAGGTAVMTIIFLSSGRLAPNLPLAIEVLGWLVPFVGLFVVAYAGISVPVIGVGLLVDPIGLEGAGLVFIACMAALVGAAAVYLMRRPVPADA